MDSLEEATYRQTTALECLELERTKLIDKLIIVKEKQSKDDDETLTDSHSHSHSHSHERGQREQSDSNHNVLY